MISFCRIGVVAGLLSAALLAPPVLISDVAAQSQIRVADIRVEGNNRIEAATVFAYLTLAPGDVYNAGDADRSLKALFATGLFSDVTMTFQDAVLNVEVTENPIINRIVFEGNRRIKDENLSQEIRLRSRVVYTRTKVQADVQRILELYRRRGRFAATVVPKVIQRPQNRVDLVFELNEGESTGVREISFVGNKFFTDKDLRAEIVTDESAWWRLLTTSDNYDPDRVTFDRELLRRHYLRNGFPDFRVLSSVAELTPDRTDFFLTFTIEEGERYRFGDLTVNPLLENVDTAALEELIAERITYEEWFNNEAIDDIVDHITEAVNDQGIAFVDVRPRIQRDRDTLMVNVAFDIDEGDKVFVERIDITGNVRTLDEVIRREFQLVEGDPFNTAKLRRSRTRLQDLGFFAKVDVAQSPGEASDQTVIDVEVEEKSTGALTFGGGYGSDAGLFGLVSLREQNLLGKGQDLRLSTSLGQKDQRIDVSFTEPYFLDRDVSAGIDVFRIVSDNQKTSSFSEKNTGLRLRTGYRITEYWSQTVNYEISQNEISKVKKKASRFVKQEQGTNVLSSIGHRLSYDRRDRRLETTSGYLLGFGNQIAGLGGTKKWLRSDISGAYYWLLWRETVVSVRSGVGYIFGLGKDVSIGDRYFLGGGNLRGFKSSGAGPRDIATSDALGGKFRYTGGVEMQFPLNVAEELDFKGKIFSDFGTLTGLDKAGGKAVHDTGSLRASAGIGVGWSSPLGVIGVDLAVPLLKENHDGKEVLRLNFGTRF